MKNYRIILSGIIVLFLSVSIMSCKKDDPAPKVLSAVTYTNLAADPPSGGYDPTNGQAIGVTNKFTFFSFKTGAIVSNTDSASTKWDIGFRSTVIILNGGTSGPGVGGAIVQTAIFSEVLVSPETGFLQDDKTNSASPYAIPKGSGKGWYNYDGATNVISPIAGRVILVKTAEGKYAKVEILSYYRDAPAAPTSSSVDRNYTFRYIYQEDGTAKLQ
jgi:HmuY protein